MTQRTVPVAAHVPSPAVVDGGKEQPGDNSHGFRRHRHEDLLAGAPKKFSPVQTVAGHRNRKDDPLGGDKS